MTESKLIPVYLCIVFVIGLMLGCVWTDYIFYYHLKKSAGVIAENHCKVIMSELSCTIDKERFCKNIRELYEKQ